MIHEKFIRACQVPGLVAHFPLNGTYGTKEINNWVPEAVASDVTFAKGPNGHSQGSYQFNGSSNSYILFSNYNGGPLDVRHAISITCWLYYDGQDGPIFSYGRSNWGVDFWVLEKKLYFRLVTRQGSQQIEALDAMTQASKWTFVGASYDSSSGDARLWSQGFFQTLNVGVGLDLSTGLNVRMGAKTGNSSYFKGRISQLQIFKRSLTAEEIQAVQSEVSGMKLCHKIFFFLFTTIFSVNKTRRLDEPSL